MYKTNESGRSMVEMLGVLAIIGVLSVGGVAGYRYAMDTLKTNNILYGLNRMAHTCLAQMGMQARECSLAEYGQKLESYPFEMISFPKQTYFGIKLSNVPESICKKMHITGLPISSLILPGTCEGTKDMVFIFNQNLTSDNSEGPTVCSDESHCGDCEQCSENGICESSCGTDQTCAKDFEDPSAPKSCCPTGNLVGGVCCNNPDGYGNCCDSKGGNCCPPDKPMMGRDGLCYGCDENVKVEVDERTHKCNRCQNRVYQSATYGYIGWCRPKECPEDKPIQSYTGVCYPCGVDVDLLDLIRPSTNKVDSCYKCPENSVFDDRMCLICPENMVKKNGQCVCPDGQMASYSERYSGAPTCYSCGADNLNAIAYQYGNTQNPCSACPDRIVVNPKEYYFYYCALKDCPDGYMHDKYGFCRSCSKYGDINFKQSSLSNSCSECKGLRYTEGNYCKKCPSDISNLTAEQQAECLSNS